jgi:glycosyltransferase involved in cell wall biosynthesis
VSMPLDKMIVIVPAFNEESCIGSFVDEIRATVPGFDVLVVNDGSSDMTGLVARKAGAIVLDLPCNLGVGGAVQAGFKYAYENGYDAAVRCDGDGQHPPSEIHKLISCMKTSSVDLVVGSRFLVEESYKSTMMRSVGIRFLAELLSIICRSRVTDPTSGFQMFNRPLLYFFSCCYPTDYPEPEALALLRREGYNFCEVGTVFRKRRTGKSTIGNWSAFLFVLKVSLALLVDRARSIDLRYARWNVINRMS